MPETDLFAIAAPMSGFVRFSASSPGRCARYRFVGTPEQIVDFMEKWVDEGAADGFNMFMDIPDAEAQPQTSLCGASLAPEIYPEKLI